MFYCSNCENIYDISDNPINELENKTKSNDYFVCKTCFNSEPIKAGTLLFSKSNNLDLLKHVNPDIKINNYTLLQTRNYICPNKDCVTHKHPELRHANLERISHKSYKMRYICTQCKTEWI